MKLTVIGGGGVRAPLLMPALARRQEVIDLQEVVLLDTDEAKLQAIGALTQWAADRCGAAYTVVRTSDPVSALTGADAVITTLRAGSEDARVQDERIALENGVLGQETTGAGGFAMALRTVPAVSSYARMMRDYCPDAWLLNFTNPAGLVAQALTEEFPDLKVVGICDSPGGLWRAVASAFGRSIVDVPVRFFGLNHLSWMAEARVDGENVVPRIIADDRLRDRVPEVAYFDPDLLRLIGLLPNEYLYYYYYRDRAVANIRAAGETRGEQVRRLSATLARDLREIDPVANPAAAWERYRQYLGERHGTYMAAETGTTSERNTTEEEPSYEGEGYAGVALDILAAAGGQPATLIANVPNRGAITGMADDDVVETVCRCDDSGLCPIEQGEPPPDELLLMQQVKRYERLTVQAIRERSRDLATEALMVHPLIGSYSVAQGLVDAYLAAHREHVGEWAV